MMAGGRPCVIGLEPKWFALRGELPDTGLWPLGSVGVDIVGESRLRMEFAEPRREIYGLGDGLGLSVVVGEAALGILGDRSRSVLRFGSDSPAISIPYSSVRGRGGGLSTMASRSYKDVSKLRVCIGKYVRHAPPCAILRHHILLPFLRVQGEQFPF